MAGRPQESHSSSASSSSMTLGKCIMGMSLDSLRVP